VVGVVAVVVLVPLLLPDLRLLTHRNQTRPLRPVMQQAGGPDFGPVPLSVGSPTHSSAPVEDTTESHRARIPSTQNTTSLVVRPVSVPPGSEAVVVVVVSGEVVCVARRCSNRLVGPWADGAGEVDRRGGGGTTTTTTTEVLGRARAAG
jgi:hypothetical protein